MFIKYPKTFRILVPEVNIKGKHYLSDDEVKLLLAGDICATEKLDGCNVGIIKTKDGFRLQKRGGLVGQSEHPQYQMYKAWSQINYDKLLQLPENTITFGEFLYAKHTVFYDKLPDWFVAFALYNYKRQVYYHRDELTKLCDNIGLCYTPELARGHFERTELFNLIPKVSNYSTSEMAEGIVIEKLKDGSRGKIVRAEFLKHIEENDHWLKYNITKNQLKK